MGCWFARTWVFAAPCSSRGGASLNFGRDAGSSLAKDGWGKLEPMEQQMTIEQIEAQFESEWVLVEDPQTNEDLEVLSGQVRHHSKDRDEVYRTAVALRPKRSAILYTGEIPEDTAVVL